MPKEQTRLEATKAVINSDLHTALSAMRDGNIDLAQEAVEHALVEAMYYALAVGATEIAEELAERMGLAEEVDHD